ncbi:MAG TPA: hypothetical protein VG738_23090 [Chitinophagaceae bacterium]|nr:hypothetical protein [Chitinophagaceae bacterium]
MSGGFVANGYLYVYVSNESPQDVFFDNVTIQHKRGPLLQEDHYYRFGLVQAGISSQSASKLENLKKYNKGSELQHKEFSDGSGLETHTTQFRMLDPQLGRWWQVDPKPTVWESVYASMKNNPFLYNDYLGDSPKPKIPPIICIVCGEGPVPHPTSILPNFKIPPLVGHKIINVVEAHIIKDKKGPWDDEFKVTGYTGTVKGTEGLLATTETKLSDGKEISNKTVVGPVSVGNGEISLKAGIAGFEVEQGVNFKEASLVVGSSYTNEEKGTVTGFDGEFKPRGGTEALAVVAAAAAVTEILAPEASPAVGKAVQNAFHMVF